MPLVLGISAEMEKADLPLSILLRSSLAVNGLPISEDSLFLNPHPVAFINRVQASTCHCADDGFPCFTAVSIGVALVKNRNSATNRSFLRIPSGSLLNLLKVR